MSSRFHRFLGVTVIVLTSAPSAYAQKLLADGGKDLASQIAASISKEQKKRIAVLPFRELDGRPTVLGTFIAEELVSQLFAVGTMDIVERSLLDKVMSEIKLDASGAIDPQTAKQVGKVAGVEAIVTGTITELDSYVAVNCRMIDALTGRVFSAAQTKILKDADLRKLIGASLAVPSPAGGAAPTGNTSPPSKQTAPAVPKSGGDGFMFELQACRRTGSSLACDLLVTNERDDRTLLVANSSACQTRVFDTSGNEYAAHSYQLGNSPVNPQYSERMLVAGVPTRLRLGFEGVNPGATTIAVLEIPGRGPTNFAGFCVKFRNFPTQ